MSTLTRLFSFLLLALLSITAYATPFVLNVTTSNGSITGTIDIDTVAGVATGANLIYAAGPLVRTIKTAPVSQGVQPATGSVPGNPAYFINFADTGIQFHLTFPGATLVNFTGGTYVCSSQYFCLIQARPIVVQAISTLTLDVGTDTVVSGNFTATGPGPVTISPGSVVFTNPITVTLAGTANASIYYTLDGTPPTAASLRYTRPLTIGTTTTIETFEQFDSLPALPSAVTTATYTYTPPPTQTGTFDPTNVQLNGSAVIKDSALQLTVDDVTNQAGSAFSRTPQNIQSFTTDFTFQFTNGSADGFMFVLQNTGSTALGTYGEGLGYAGIAKSVGIKFDLYNNNGEGINSTGIYQNGALPTLPAIDLTPSAIDLHSGHLMKVHMTYDGGTLFVNVLDTVTQRIALQTYTVDLPTLLNSPVAYAGFTGSTGGLAIKQDILSWTFEPGVAIPAPTFSPDSNSVYGYGSGVNSVTLTDSIVGAQIFYTLDGSIPGAAYTPYTGPISIGGTTTINAIAVVNGVSSPISTGTYTKSSGGLALASMTLNGSAQISAVNYNALFLTQNVNNQAGSAFYPTPVNVQSFIADFDFIFPQVDAYPNKADGMMFVIQNQGPTALGPYGANLGFAGIQKSVGVKLDIYNNLGEGAESTGLYLNGAQPILPAIDLTNAGLSLKEAYIHHVHITYVNPLLTVTISSTDSTPSPSATQVYQVDIPSIVGGATAYVGFTGGTGGLTVVGEVQYLNYSTP